MYSPSPAKVTSPYKWKIIEWYEKPKTKQKQKTTTFYSEDKKIDLIHISTATKYIITNNKQVIIFTEIEIVKHPTSCTVRYGQSCTFICEAHCKDLQLHFQWYKDDKLLPGIILKLQLLHSFKIDHLVYETTF